MTRRGKVIQFPKRQPPPEPAPALVEVRRCRDQSEALVVRALLDGHGIPAVMRGQLVHSSRAPDVRAKFLQEFRGPDGKGYFL